MDLILCSGGIGGYRRKGSVEDLSGRVFGRLTVCGPVERRDKTTYWCCKCGCGKTKWVVAAKLKNGHTRSCGCLHSSSGRCSIGLDAAPRQVKDRTGERHGRLVVIERSPSRDGRLGKSWICRCDCGKEVAVRGQHFNGKEQASCGCLARENASRAVRFNFAGRWRQIIPTERPAAWALLKGYESGALRRGLAFELTADDFSVLTKDVCFYCGAPPHRSYRGNRSSGRYTYNGIDRLDNALGYVTGNGRFVPLNTK